MKERSIQSNRPLLVGSEWLAETPGGLNRYFSGLVSYLSRTGLPVRALVVGQAEGAPPEITGSGSARKPLIRRLLALRKAALEAGHGATMVDAHFALYALPVLVSRLRRLPFVVHFQGPWADESAYGSSAGSQTALKKVIERIVYRHADQCVALSSDFKRILVERYRVVPWIVSVIPPGVDLVTFSTAGKSASRRAAGLPPQGRIVLTVRRLIPRTGVDDLIHAWANVSGQIEGERLLLVAGEGPSRSHLQSLAMDLGISESVRFVGRVSDQRLADLYRAADFSVVPSRALEGFGLVVLESFACGTPVVATAAGGLPEAVGSLGERLLAQPADPESLGRCLAVALQGDLPDPEACRKYAENFSWDRVGKENLEVYRKATRGPEARRPRVVYIDHVARLSGGEIALLRLLKGLPEVEAHVVLGENGPLIDHLTQAGISAEVMAMPEAGRNLSRHAVRPGALPVGSALAASAYVGRLAAWLRRMKPDIVHTNSLKAALYGGMAARLAGVRCVWHVRDSITPEYMPGPAVRLVRTMARTLPHGVIANSRTTLQNLGPLHCPTAVVGSPLDDAFFRQGSSPSGTGRTLEENRNLKIAILGRLAEWKGQDVFLQAFAEAFPENGHQAVIAGSSLFGEHGLRAELARLADHLGLDGRLDFKGFVSDVPAFLREVDILVHASKTPEPFGLSVVEGMASGLPVVASAAGGPAEVIRDGENGLLFPPGSSSALASALQKLAGDPGLRRRLGEAARLKAREFSAAEIAKQVLNFYGHLGVGFTLSRGEDVHGAHQHAGAL